MSNAVVDASSALVIIKDEPGADALHERLALDAHFISAVNVAEVLSRLSDLGLSDSDASIALAEVGLAVVPFSASQAARAAALRAPTRQFGLSLGGRACLALAIELNVPALTADRDWMRLDLPVAVVLTR